MERQVCIIFISYQKIDAQYVEGFASSLVYNTPFGDDELACEKCGSLCHVHVSVSVGEKGKSFN